LLTKASVGLQVNDHIVEPGDVVFRHACQLGFEGIVSKRLGSPYHSGRSRHWIKTPPQRIRPDCLAGFSFASPPEHGQNFEHSP
jgi:bifunctional non-homologous end joining protein LigD